MEEVQGQISLLRAVSDDGAEFCREVERDSRETLFNDDSHAAKAFAAQKMREDGYVFYLFDGGVWGVEYVPAQYVSIVAVGAQK